MKIGIPKEIKSGEGRVALLPKQVKSLTERGHDVIVGQDAGLISGATDKDYITAGTTIGDNKTVYQTATLILKVKEILPEEFDDLRQEHIILTNIHAAADKVQLDKLLAVGLTAISLENTHQNGSPNCPLAGEIGALEGIRLSLSTQGGSGKHFMRHYDAPASKALVIGLGQVGRGALRTLLNLGVDVIGLDISPYAIHHSKLDYYNQSFTADSIDNIHRYLYDVDMIFNCVMWPKHRNDHLIYQSDLKKLQQGCVIVDIACDKAGAIETCQPTTWQDPTYQIEGITHFCVDNIPGAVPQTASAGNGYANLHKIIAIAEDGVISAVKNDTFLARGLTCHAGKLILKEAGVVQNRPYQAIEDWLAAH